MRFKSYPEYSSVVGMMEKSFDTGASGNNFQLNQAAA